MKEINEKLEKLKIVSRTRSIREDLGKENGDMTFSEESRRRDLTRWAKWICSSWGNSQQQFNVVLA